MKALVTLNILLLGTILAFLMTPPLATIEDVGVSHELPDRIGDYRGVDILFCQNDQCALSFNAANLNEGSVCPSCGAALDPVSLSEHQSLPPDTTFAKKRYETDEAQPMFVSVVTGHSHQRSIHRPQQCLPAQGNIIESQRTVSLEAADPTAEPLRVMFLQVRRQTTQLQGNRTTSHHLFAYWFVAPHATTPYHLERLAEMAFDRVVAGRTYRWSYVAVLTDVNNLHWSEAETRMRDFILALRPHLHPAPDQ